MPYDYQKVSDRQSYELTTHFIPNAPATELPLVITNTGTGATLAQPNVLVPAPGMLRQQLGTTLDSSTAARTPLSIMFGGTLNYALSARIRLPVIPDVPGNFVCLFGFGGDRVPVTDELNKGIYFYLDASGLYLASKNTGAGISYGIQLPPLVGNVYYNLEMRISSDGIANCYLDSALIATFAAPMNESFGAGMWCFTYNNSVAATGGVIGYDWLSLSCFA